jgi:hypothetical protein
MDALFLFVFILIIIVICIIAYFTIITYDAIQSKSQEQNAMKNSLEQEQLQRVGNTANVVSQVNNTHSLMYTALTSNATNLDNTANNFTMSMNSNIDGMNTNMSELDMQYRIALGMSVEQQTSANRAAKKYDNMNNGINSIFNMSSPKDVELVRHVTATMGMTAQDLQTNSLTVNNDINLGNLWKISKVNNNICFINNGATIACMDNIASKIHA